MSGGSDPRQPCLHTQRCARQECGQPAGRSGLAACPAQQRGPAPAHPPGRRPACRFRIADADRDGVLTGAEAVGFFQRSGLPQQTLFKVWQMISWRGA